MTQDTSAQTWNESTPPMIRLPDLKGRSAIVTGASRGIGQSVIESLKANDVFCFGLSNERMESSDTDSFVPLQCELGDVSAIRSTIASIKKQTNKIDYLVNVAGIDPRFSLEGGDESDWQRVMDINLRAYYLLIRECYPLLKQGQGKSIVNVASISDRIGNPGLSIYGTSKAGILGLTRSLARELGQHSIRINSISPGWVFTETQKKEHFEGEGAEETLELLSKKQSIRLKLHPQDIANHILFYLSEVSRGSTGHDCVVDAGWILD